MLAQDVLTPAVTTATRETAWQISRDGDEEDWVHERRLAAWKAYESLDLPDPFAEEWRRIDLRNLPLRDLPVDLGDGEALGGDESMSDSSALSGALMLDDGKDRLQWIDPDLQKQGVIFGRLSDATHANGSGEQLLKANFGSVVPADEWKYVALNTALWTGGSFLYVPDNVEITLPFHVLRESLRDNVAIFPRTLIVVGRNSRVALIDERRSGDGLAAFVSEVAEIVVGDGSKVEYYEVNNWGDGVYNFKTTRARLARDASFQSMQIGLGSKLTKSRLDVLLSEEGSNAELLGLFLGSGDQHFDYDTRQDHIAPRTRSDLLFKAALQDRSSIAWTGVVDVRKTASKSEANQTSRNLLLSDQAKAAPTPILEISAYDVAKCSHGATVGPVDEEQLYYLQTRGIPAEEAERMLVEGFFAQVIERVPSERLRGRVQKALAEKVGWLD